MRTKIKFSKITEELKIKICNDYINAKLRIIDLCNFYGVNEVQLRKIVTEKNIPKRRRPEKINVIEINENYFEDIDTSNKAYWLGFIAADGCIKKEKNYLQLNIRISSKDEGHLEKFKNDIGAHQKIKYTETYDKRTNKIYKSHGIQISRRKICEDLIKHGVGPNKSKELYIPKTIPENLIHHFIRGYSDGDASFNFSKRNGRNYIRYSVISSTKSVIEEIQEIFCKKCDVKPHKIFAYKKNSAYKIYYQTDKEVKKIYNYLYEGDGPKLDRKYNLASNHFKSTDHLINIAKSRN